MSDFDADDVREPASLHDELDQEPVAGVPPTPQQHFASRFGGLKGVLAPLVTTVVAFLWAGSSSA